MKKLPPVIKIGSDCEYLTQYHTNCCSKLRYSVLSGDVKSDLREILFEISKKYEYEIIELEAMSDHIHIFVSTKPTTAPIDLVRTFKSITAILKISYIKKNIAVVVLYGVRAILLALLEKSVLKQYKNILKSSNVEDVR